MHCLGEIIDGLEKMCQILLRDELFVPTLTSKLRATTYFIMFRALALCRGREMTT